MILDAYGRPLHTPLTLSCEWLTRQALTELRERAASQRVWQLRLSMDVYPDSQGAMIAVTKPRRYRCR